MVKNTKGGKGAKSKARKNLGERETKYSELIKTEDQEYAKILNVYGGGRCKVRLFAESAAQEKELLAVSCGRIKRYAKLKPEGLVLVSLRDFQEGKCDILHAYNAKETQMLIDHGDIKSNFVVVSEEQDDDLDINFETEVDFKDL